MKRSIIYKVLCSVILFFALHFFTRWQTEGFRLTKATMRYCYPFKAKLEDAPQCLNQTFHYLGKGVQFYVFVGEDNETVLKLFNHHHFGFSLDTMQLFFPRKMIRNVLRKRERRMVHLLRSADIARKVLPEETGVFYAHLMKSHNVLGKGTIVDKIGVRHCIDFDQTEFVLQKKGETVEQRLRKLFQNQDVEGAIQSMRKIQNLLEEYLLKGIENKDGKLLRNCGFIGDRAVQLDIGSLNYCNKFMNPRYPCFYKKTVIRCTIELLGWVKKHYPEHLKQCKDALYYEVAL